MSLEKLKTLRIGGYKPKAVHVLVGDVPAWANDEPDTVCIKRSDRVNGMDLRPLVGLDVSIFQLGDCDDLLKQSIVAVEASKPALLMIAANAGMVGLSEANERVLESLKVRYSCKF